MTRFRTAPVVIARECSFRGLLSFEGRARVEGEIRGEIVAETGGLWLGEASRVRAHIEVDELVVDGLLEGDVVARSRIELRATARVRGDLRAPRVALAEGCLLEGRCQTGENADFATESGASPA